MKTEIQNIIRFARWTGYCLCVAFITCSTSFRAEAQGYRVEKLVSDVPGNAPTLDTNLVNGWGIIATPKTLIVCATETSSVRMYSRDGGLTGAAISVEEDPTGLIMNDSPTGFMIPGAKKPRQSTLIFVTEAGKILGWSPKDNLTEAVATVDNEDAGAIYKGVAMAGGKHDARLFAANFHGGVVESYDEDWNKLRSFSDPSVDPGFAPFNVANIDGKLYVSFAKQLAPDFEDDEAGAGNGFVDEFDTDGILVRRFASHGVLNSPWAMVMAPKHFGQFSNALLIGNFGDGWINAFDPQTGAFLGSLSDEQGNPLHISGLWGLSFGKGGGGGKGDVLYFSSGPEDESHGVVGRITVIPEPHGHGGGH